MNSLFVAGLIGFFLIGHGAHGAEPILTIQMGSQKRELLYRDFLKRPSIQKIKVEEDPAYGGTAHEYSALPAAEVLSEFSIPADATVVFHCLDGFSGPLSREAILNTSPNKAQAFIAFENPQAKWPPIKAGSPATPGPYYLIWKDPKKSGIAREQWPYQLASLEIKPSLTTQFPHIVPSSKDSSIQAGFQSFVKNCFTCHTMNGEGTSRMGPDLNWPSSPIDYMHEKALRTLIRDPQGLRQWPDAKMKGFSVQDLPNQELDQIISYLKHMAKIRRPR